MAAQTSAQSRLSRMHCFSSWTLGEAGIGTGRTGLGAGVTFIDAPDQGLAHVASDVGVHANDLSCVHEDLLSEKGVVAPGAERSAVTATDRVPLRPAATSKSASGTRTDDGRPEAE